jgi:hypothetical protein
MNTARLDCYIGYVLADLFLTREIHNLFIVLHEYGGSWASLVSCCTC